MNAILRQNFLKKPVSGPILCFFHLPRTGGTTLNRVFSFVLREHAVFHADLCAACGGEAGLAAALMTDHHIYDRMMLLTGHYGLTHPLIGHAPRPIAIAAVLRHPLERIVSLFDYIRGRPDHPDHAALSRLSLNQALDAVPAFAAHCHNAQLRSLFNATDPNGIVAALQRYPYLLGRMDALDAFAQKLLGLFGVTLEGPLPRANERPVLPGVAPACAQADYATALARLEGYNRAELDFFARLPPIFASRPKAALAEQSAA